MTTTLKLATGWILFMALSHWNTKTDWIGALLAVLMLLAFIGLVCATLLSILFWALSDNEKEARKAGIKIGSLIIPLVFCMNGCASKSEVSHKFIDSMRREAAKASQRSSWCLSNPTNTPICR